MTFCVWILYNKFYITDIFVTKSSYFKCTIVFNNNIDDLVQDCGISIADAMEIPVLHQIIHMKLHEN